MSRWDTRPQRVICLSTGQVYSSITDAGKKNGVPGSSIMRAIKGSRVCAGKYWALLPDDLDGIALEQWRVSKLLSYVGYEIVTKTEEV